MWQPSTWLTRRVAVNSASRSRLAVNAAMSRTYSRPGDPGAGALVVDGDRLVLVARRAGDLQAAAAEIEGQHLAGPASEAEVGLHVVKLMADDRGVRPAGEVEVAGHVVAVPVGVRHHQLVAERV